MIKKSGYNSPFQGEIQGKPWLVCVTEAQMTSTLSYLFKEKQNEIKDVFCGKVLNLSISSVKKSGEDMSSRVFERTHDIVKIMSKF